MTNIEVPSTAWFTYHLNAGEDWTRNIIAQNPSFAEQPVAQAKMEIRNSAMTLVMTLDSTVNNSGLVVNSDGTLTLHLTSAQTMKFGIGFPGVVQAVSYWGIGRAYLYDLFVKYGVSGAPWAKLQYGTIQVVPAITVDLP